MATPSPRALARRTGFANSDSLDGAVTVGFSASEYTLSGGKTVIAYRGTDFDFSSAAGIGGLIADVVGWFSSFGVLGDEVGPVKLQPYYAQQFYELVTGRLLFPEGGGSGTPDPNIIITGHSLGGSLAGYIASLSKDQAVIFNEIPYLGLALTKAVNTFVNSVKDQPDFSTLLEELGKLLNGEESSLSFNLPTVGNITSFQTVNEIAHLARILGPFLGAAAHAYFSNLVTAAVASAALGYGLTTFALQPTVSMPHHGGLLQNPINLHSQALMVLLTFAASKNYEDWKAVGKPLLDALFSDDVGNAANATQLQGYGGASPKLMAAIAYSTVDPGSSTVFGDTGALSLFDDANDLGYCDQLTRPQSILRNADQDRRRHSGDHLHQGHHDGPGAVSQPNMPAPLLFMKSKTRRQSKSWETPARRAAYLPCPKTTVPWRSIFRTFFGAMSSKRVASKGLPIVSSPSTSKSFARRSSSVRRDELERSSRRFSAS